MSNREEFSKKLQKELKQVSGQRQRYTVAHNFLILFTITVGSITTYLAATGAGVDNKIVLAALAALTTLAGTLEKTFSFGKAKSGFRKAKTQFEKLENELMKLKSDSIPDAYIDKLNEIKELKVELTDAS